MHSLSGYFPRRVVRHARRKPLFVNQRRTLTPVLPHPRVLPETLPPSASSNRLDGADGGQDQHGCTAGGCGGGGGTLPVWHAGAEGAHSGRTVRADGLASQACSSGAAWRRRQAADKPRQRACRYGATIKDAVIAIWEASDRVRGKRLVAMIPILLPALETHGRLRLDRQDRALVFSVLVFSVSAATIVSARPSIGCWSPRKSRPAAGWVLFGCAARSSDPRYAHSGEVGRPF